MELQSHTIIVTGAAGGIGSAITAACARQGARMAAVDRVEAVAPSGEGIPAEAVTPFLADLSVHRSPRRGDRPPRRRRRAR